jgi:hypothetical protein
VSNNERKEEMEKEKPYDKELIGERRGKKHTKRKI